MASMKDAVMDDNIIGVEVTTTNEHGPGAMEPRVLPTPHRMLPSKEAKHWLAHLPYDPACELCVQCKRHNSHHRESTKDERTIPLLVGDYCFVKDSSDGEQVTGLVLKLYPFNILFGCVVQSKASWFRGIQTNVKKGVEGMNERMCSTHESISVKRNSNERQERG